MYLISSTKKTLCTNFEVSICCNDLPTLDSVFLKNYFNKRFFSPLSRKNKSYLPVHVVPFPVYPELQVQLKDPTVLLQ